VREASLVSATAHGAVEKAYAPFAGDSESPLDLEASAEILLRTFRESVGLRAHAETCVLGISGGMDSRLLAGVLKERGHRVVTINMSPPGSQDRYFAKVASEAMGLEYFEFDFEFADDLPRTSRMSELLTSGDLREMGAATDGILWTGDGGSVGLGGVLIDDEPLAPLSNHRSSSIVSRTYLDHNRLAPSVGIFARRWREEFASIPAHNMDVELERWQPADRRRRLQLFLLTNDQRRHLQTTWEAFERLRVDFALPFFDAALIRQELSVPLDWILKHRAYQRLIHKVAGAASVPWQTYPGHEPCPLPSPPGLSYQWDQSRRSTYRAPGAMRRALASKAVAAVNGGQIPSELLDRPRILAYAAAHASGTRDCESQLKLVLSLARAAKVAPQAWAVPTARRLSA
jgi:asparagine synthase (glutamine-hydrolysing)